MIRSPDEKVLISRGRLDIFAEMTDGDVIKYPVGLSTSSSPPPRCVSSPLPSTGQFSSPLAHTRALTTTLISPWWSAWLVLIGRGVSKSARGTGRACSDWLRVDDVFEKQVLEDLCWISTLLGSSFVNVILYFPVATHILHHSPSYESKSNQDDIKRQLMHIMNGSQANASIIGVYSSLTRMK